MEILQIKNLSFTYTKGQAPALNNVSLSINKGSLTLIFGPSGCGKTTLLRLIKQEIAPVGKQSGEIIYNNTSVKEIKKAVSASEIGFVGQNPDEQLVTDKVWHELAFGLENLGADKSFIRRRVAETASYFGISHWYHKNTDELSGGQKQLLNLASVMVMQPKVLLLDEPTSQLDPIAAADFIATVQKLNRELGLTVILVEHRLEEIYPVCDLAVAMENGEIISCGEPRLVCAKLRRHPLSLAMPSATRIWNELNIDCECPLTVGEGRAFLEKYYSNSPQKSLMISDRVSRKPAIEAKNLWFRYEKNLPDVLKGLNLEIEEGEIFTVLGGNGTGKTTLLNVLSALNRAYRGSVKIFGKKLSLYKNSSLYRHTLAYLPQNPKDVFLKNTVKEDFSELLKAMDIPKADYEPKIKEISNKFGVLHLLDRHPYDLSGGEQQKCALIKLLLTEPKILLLDEPTKGMDAYSKGKFAKLLKTLQSEGKTFLLVSHDIEFAAKVSDRCGLFFDGEIISQGIPNEFFSNNSFYTTAASRISREIFENTVVCEEVVSLCKSNQK